MVRRPHRSGQPGDGGLELPRQGDRERPWLGPGVYPPYRSHPRRHHRIGCSVPRRRAPPAPRGDRQMRPGRLSPAAVAAALFAVLLVATMSSTGSAFGQQNAPASDLRVSVSKSEVSALTGDTFTFTSEITNTGSEPTPPLI